jgi:hypothetical protein
VATPSSVDERREERCGIPTSGMDGMRAAVNASAMLKSGISGGIVAEYLDAQRGPRLKVGTAGQHLDLNRNDFAGSDRLALPVGVSGTAWPASFGVERTM